MTAVLRRRGIGFAAIGAAAMAVHGVARSTADVDLLAVAPACLDVSTWQDLTASGIETRVQRGDAEDPLVGVVRFAATGEHPLDLVIPRGRWPAGILDRAREAEIEGVRVPVAIPADLILLKLYAGGPQDAWDVAQLLAGPGPAALVAEVEAVLGALPADCRRLWARIRETGG